MAAGEEHRAARMKDPGTGGDDPGGTTTTQPTGGTTVPPFQPASYTFHLDTVTITETRSVHVDTDRVAFSVAASGAPSTRTKDLGDLNNGTFPIGLTIGPIRISDPAASVSMNYLIVNAGAITWSDVAKVLSPAVESVVNGVIGAIGGLSTLSAARQNGLPVKQVSTTTLSLVASSLNALSGGVTGAALNGLLQLIGSNCNGPVAAEVGAYKGQDLWTMTTAQAYSKSTFHPGTDSNWGCGANSAYSVTWGITRS